MTGPSIPSAEEAARYWDWALDGGAAVQDLPIDRPVSPGRAETLSYHDTLLDPALTSGLHGMADGAGVSVGELLLAGFMALLYRYTERGHLTIAWMVDPPPELLSEPLAPGSRGGSTFSNGSTLVVPIRSTVSGPASFRSLLANVRRSYDLARRGRSGTGNGGPSEAQVAEYLGSIPVWFGSSSALVSGAEGSVQGVGEDASARAPAVVELGLLTTSSDSGLRLRFAYNPARYRVGYVQTMARHYGRLLECVVDAPETPVTDLSLVTPEEERQLHEWSVGGPRTDTPNLRHTRFQEHALEIPEKQAVVWESGVLSYKELDRRANQLAHYLGRLGTGPEVAVGICLPRSPDLVISYLAVLKAGGAILPLPTSAPAARLQAYLDVAVPRVILGEELEAKWLPGTEGVVVRLDDIVNELSGEPESPPIVDVSADNTAFLLATSGSTGPPKMVRTPIGYRRSPAGERVGGTHLLKSESGTTFTLAEILRPLLAGGTLVIAPDGLEHDPWSLVAFLGAHRVTHLVMTPGQLGAVLEVEDLSPCRWLKSVTCSGEPMPSDLKRQFSERLEAKLINMYGCTEAPGSTTSVCSPDDEPGVVDVGRPGPAMEAWVLDQNRRLTPTGLAGEIYFGGMLSAGYLNDAEATNQRFVPHPYDLTPGARLFHTGDRGRWLAQGVLEVLGRLDQQVKVRGYRVELREVEARLGQHEEVASCAVTMQENRTGDRRMVAFWAPKGNVTVGTEGLRRHMLEKLPDYMVPSVFVRLDSMPRTLSGKIDKNSLVAPDSSRPDLETAYAPARNEVEEGLVEIWREMLGVDEVGIHDRFLELGGDSLLAIRTVSRVRARFGHALSVPVLLDSATIAEMAAAIQDEAGGPEEPSPTEEGFI